VSDGRRAQPNDRQLRTQAAGRDRDRDRDMDRPPLGRGGETADALTTTFQIWATVRQGKLLDLNGKNNGEGGARARACA